MWFQDKEVKHYRKAFKSDVEALRLAFANDDEVQSAQKKAEVIDKLRIELANRKFTTHSVLVAPKPSQFLIRHAFSDPEFHTDADIQTFVTNVLYPIAGIDVDRPSFSANVVDAAKKSACYQAERFFHYTLEQILTDKRPTQPRIGVYHSPDAQPLALRKTHDISTALSLEPFVVGQANIPPGTIIGIADYNAEETGHFNIDSVQYSTYLVDRALDLAPRRLTPWAYDDELDRMHFAAFNQKDGFDAARGEIVRSHTIDDFRLAAGQVMNLCGVAS